MNIPNIKKMRAESGFTIVELLIVIVVIGILAAIVIVAYNGIQDRSRNTRYQTDAQSLVKVAEAINADTGSYPAGDAASFNASTVASLPQNVSVTLVTTAPTNNAAFNTAAITAADGNPRTYTVDSCGGAGLKIYYPVRGGSAAEVLNVGTTTSGC